MFYSIGIMINRGKQNHEGVLSHSFEIGGNFYKIFYTTAYLHSALDQAATVRNRVGKSNTEHEKQNFLLNAC